VFLLFPTHSTVIGRHPTIGTSQVPAFSSTGFSRAAAAGLYRVSASAHTATAVSRCRTAAVGHAALAQFTLDVICSGKRGLQAGEEFRHAGDSG
jgi:hypothetical protein